MLMAKPKLFQKLFIHCFEDSEFMLLLDLGSYMLLILRCGVPQKVYEGIKWVFI